MLATLAIGAAVIALAGAGCLVLVAITARRKAEARSRELETEGTRIRAANHLLQEEAGRSIQAELARALEAAKETHEGIDRLREERDSLSEQISLLRANSGHSMPSPRGSEANMNAAKKKPETSRRRENERLVSRGMERAFKETG